MSRNLMLVFTNAEPGKDEEFNRWYDEVHVGEVLGVTPIKACTRYRVADDDPGYRYVAIYEFEGDPDEALAALHKEGGNFDMSGPMAGQANMVRVVPISPRVESD